MAPTTATKAEGQFQLVFDFPSKAARESFVLFMDRYGEQVYGDWMDAGEHPDEVCFDYSQAYKHAAGNKPSVHVTTTFRRKT